VTTWQALRTPAKAAIATLSTLRGLQCTLYMARLVQLDCHLELHTESLSEVSHSVPASGVAQCVVVLPRRGVRSPSSCNSERHCGLGQPLFCGVVYNQAPAFCQPAQAAPAGVKHHCMPNIRHMACVCTATT